jgi:hypothetical protein
MKCTVQDGMNFGSIAHLLEVLYKIPRLLADLALRHAG